MERVIKGLSFQWNTLPLDIRGITQFVVSDSLNEIKKTGRRTRFVKYEPGAKTGVFIHDYNEEVYVIQGEQRQIINGSEFVDYSSGDFIERPPGTQHGPFESTRGCILLEVHFYD